MAKQIKGTDIIEDGHLSNAIKQAQELLELYKKLDETILKTAKDTKTAAKGTGTKRAKEIQEINKNLNKSKSLKEADLKLDKEKARLEQRLSGLRKNQAQQNAILNEQVKRQAKANRDNAKAVLDSKNAFEKLKTSTNKAQMEFKKMAAQFGVNSKQAKKAKIEFDKLDKELRQINNAARDGRGDVGRYGLALKGAAGGLKNLAGALGLVAGVQLFTRVIKDAFNVVKNFDQAQADLSSVLGVTKDQMTGLTEQAKELGATTKFTASQVAELQISFAKLGFTQQQISEMTESTLQLASAAGTDLDNAATIVGSTLRGFGLEANETQRVVDVMAKSFSSSSLDIEKFKVAMAAAAPVAKTFGFSVEETTALIGTLTDRGIDASAAGTGLRNMFLDSNKAGLTFQEALDQINNASDKAGKSFELFGKRGATLGVILAENQASTSVLEETLLGAGGAAEEMADKQLDTLAGSLDLLRSAWEGFILGADGAGGASEKLKNIIKFLANNLEDIIKTVGRFVALWGSYKIALKAATVSNKLFGGSLSKMKSTFGAIGLAVTALIIVVRELISHYSEASLATKALNEATNKINTRMDEEVVKLQMLGKQLFKTNTASKEREELLNSINKEYGTTLENLEDEAKFVEQVRVAYLGVIKALRAKIALQVLEEELVEANKALRELERQSQKVESGLFGLGIANDAVVTALDDQREAVRLLEGEYFQIQKALGETTEEVEDLENAEEDLGEETDETTGSFKEQNNEIKKLIVNLGTVGKALDKFFSDNEKRRKARKREVIEIDEPLPTIDDLLAEADDGQIIEDGFEIKKPISDLEKLRDESLAIFKEITDGLIKNIDKRIEARRGEIDDANNNISRLQDLAAEGNTDAAEAIEAERIRVANEKLEIEQLEKRKRNLLIVVTALEKANQNLGQGDGNAFKNASASMKDFLASLPTFSEGTVGTVAQALGKTGTKDGHVVRVDDREHILSIKDSERLHRAGLTSNDAIVGAAMAAQNNALSKRILRPSVMTDQNIVSELKDVKKAIKGIEITQQHIDLLGLKEVIKKGNKTIKNDYNPKWKI